MRRRRAPPASPSLDRYCRFRADFPRRGPRCGPIDAKCFLNARPTYVDLQRPGEVKLSCAGGEEPSSEYWHHRSGDRARHRADHRRRGRRQHRPGTGTKRGASCVRLDPSALGQPRQGPQRGDSPPVRGLRPSGRPARHPRGRRVTVSRTTGPSTSTCHRRWHSCERSTRSRAKSGTSTGLGRRKGAHGAGGREQGEQTVDGQHPRAIGTPHDVGRRGDNRAVVRFRLTVSPAVRREQALRAHHTQHPRPRNSHPSTIRSRAWTLR